VVGGADPFEAIDKKTARKWIEKAFDLASELNDDFTAISEEKDVTDEMLQKSRNWIAHMYYEDEETDGDHSSSHQPDPSVSSRTEFEDRKSTSVPIPDKPYEDVSKTPKSENRSDEEMFRVSIDLLGVDRTDVDITLVEDGGDNF
jgi:HSP20 family molecular chaperone IbpA